MVEILRVRAHSIGRSHPWNFKSAISSSASSDFMYSIVSAEYGWRAWGQ